MKILSDQDEGRIFSVEEAATLCRCGKRTILERIHKGELRATRMGRRFLISAKDLDRCLSLRATY